jgi:heme A synthase
LVNWFSGSLDVSRRPENQKSRNPEIQKRGFYPGGELTVSDFHGSLANTILYYFILLATWGTFRFLRKQGVSSSFWGALVIAETLLIAQVLLGGYMWLSDLRPARSVHLLYGFFSLLTIPGMFMYTKGRSDRPEMLMYSVIALVMIGVLLRAAFTGEG